MINNKKIIYSIAIVILALAFYSAGYLVGHANLVFEKNLVPKISNQELYKPREVDFSIFWKAWEAVEKNYVGQVDRQKMVYGAISGMLGSLKDPYTVFMEPSSGKMFLEDLSGQIQGIGAEISIKDDQLVIVAPIADSPAEKSGLKAKDAILKIDDTDSGNLTIDEAITKIRGTAGTKVKLTIMREGWQAPQVFEITRAKITIKSVEWQIKDNNIGYIKVSQFGEDTTRLMIQASKEMAAKNVNSVILDLRNNPGGYLQSAVEMAGLYLPKDSVVVKEKDKSGKIEIEKTVTDPILPNAKIIILTNSGSASASEIVAGALQDSGRAQLAGEKTFGKGSVQTLGDLGGGSTLRLTIAEWLTPKDRAINHQGIEPDVKVGLTEDDFKAGRDPQLEKALEIANN